MCVCGNADDLIRPNDNLVHSVSDNKIYARAHIHTYVQIGIHARKKSKILLYKAIGIYSVWDRMNGREVRRKKISIKSFDKLNVYRINFVTP